MNREEAAKLLGDDAVEAKTKSAPRLLLTEKKGTFILGEVVEESFHQFAGNERPTKYLKLKVEATDMRIGVKSDETDDDGNPVFTSVPLPDDKVVSFACPSRLARLDIKVGQRVHITYLGKSAKKAGQKPGADFKVLVSGAAKVEEEI